MIRITRAQARDAEALTRIAFAAKRHWQYPEDWMQRWRDELTVSPAYIEQNPTFFAEADGVMAGFCAVTLSANEANLDHLWVLPMHLRQGIGSALFRQAEETARAAGASRLRIVGDPHAEVFYTRMGATLTGRQAAPMDGTERHLPVFEKRVCPEAETGSAGDGPPLSTKAPSAGGNQTAAVPARLASFWNDFARGAGSGVQARFHDAYCFGDSEELADSLAELVLRGAKRATTTAVWAYAAEGKSPPVPGSLSIVTAWSGEPLCIVETLCVEILPFRDVGAGFAAEEGEGDGSLAHWREGHRAYFTRECAAAGREFSESMPVACERFRVVFPEPAEQP